MFTGIIHGQGEVVSLKPQGREMRLTLRALFALDTIVIGESIAVNGVCLTVERGDNNIFSAYASAETMTRTNLGTLKQGTRVNLERALAVGQRLGGHIVSGHVDCLSTVEFCEQAGQSLRVRLAFPEECGPEVIAKGSVTLDGISLTINHCGPTFLEVNVIPETSSVTTAGTWNPGVKVNMETDIIGKYVRHMLLPWKGVRTVTESAVTEDLLKKHGFI